MLWKSNYQIGSGFFHFLARRAVRLYPPYFLAGGVAVGMNYVSFFLGGQSAHVSLISDVLCNLLLTCDLFGGTWFNPVFWSLAVEVQYYIVAGLAFPLLLRLARLRVLLYCLVLGSALSGQGLNLMRWPSLFLLGFALFLFKNSLMGRREFRFACAALLSAQLVAFDPRVFLAGLFAMFFIVSSGVGWKPVLSLGSFSYSIYLVHVPLGTRVINFAVRLDISGMLCVVVIVLAALVSLAFARVFFECIEAPSIKMSRFIKQSRVGT